LRGHTGVISSLAFVPGSDLVVSGSRDDGCRIWSANEGREVGPQMTNEGGMNAVAVSVDGKTMACGGDGGRIVICNLVTREKIIQWRAGDGAVLSLSFSSEGTLASGHQNRNFVFWNASTGAPEAGPFKLHSSSVNSISFSPSGDRIASGASDGRVRVVYSHLGQDVILTIGGQAHVRSVVWSPDGQQIISASNDRTIKLWNSSDGSLLATCEGHTDWITSIAISSDGEVLASASPSDRDHTVRLWNMATYQQIGPPLKHSSRLVSVAMSSDGHYLAGGGGDEKVYIWN
ncbi:hypothetical protein HYDPIDRAFT_62469, partial [Hydnomerulius pinastri MD-312]